MQSSVVATRNSREVVTEGIRYALWIWELIATIVQESYIIVFFFRLWPRTELIVRHVDFMLDWQYSNLLEK